MQSDKRSICGWAQRVYMLLSYADRFILKAVISVYKAARQIEIETM